jgi:Xaa-Pro aminopeptidase
VLAAAPELRVGADTDVRYVPAADLYYLTGYVEPEAVLVLSPAAREAFTMFVRPRDPERELWTGSRGGVEAARDAFGADAAFPLAELPQRLTALLAPASILYAALESGRLDVDAALRAALAAARRTRPRTGRGAHTVADPHVLLGPMRLRKDAAEIETMRAAAAITVAGFRAAAATLAHATHEYEVEAAVDHAFRSRGAMGPAFPTIAAAGARATVLHYTSNDLPIGADDLLLLDAGARVRMYCADVTRTWPRAGRFSAAQRAVYDVVLAAHDAAIAAAVAGAPVTALDGAALEVLAQGMVDLDLLHGSPADIIEQRAYRRFFPHRVSHWLGLDVHDAGDYGSDSEPGVLEAGMVLTVEPGIYIPEHDDAVPAALRGIGIRLEDDVLVTGGGPDVLTAGLAIRPDDVEEAVRG